MKKQLFLLTVTVLLTLFCSAQGSSSENWSKLARIEYDKSEDEYGEIYIPVFSEEVLEMEGVEIALEGFIIPFQGMFDPEKVILSSLPIASCFFCGGGGPETVAQIYLSESINYTAKAVRVTGKLELNSTDSNELMYILRDAELEIIQ
jgi:hypothetical protein